MSDQEVNQCDGISRAQAKELLDRCRRIETRFTKYLESKGFDTKVQRPTFADGRVIIPSLACSIGDAMAVVPKDWDATVEIEIVHQNSVVMGIYLGPHT